MIPPQPIGGVTILDDFRGDDSYSLGFGTLWFCAGAGVPQMANSRWRALGWRVAILVALGATFVWWPGSTGGAGAAEPGGKYVCTYVPDPTPEHHTECQGGTFPSEYRNDRNLSYADLREADITGRGMPFVILHRANVERADLTGAELNFARDMTDADFAGAVMKRIQLEKTDFANADLSGATLTDADLYHSTMDGVRLTGVISGGISRAPRSLPPEWNLVGGYLVGPGANLHGANLSGLDLSGATLTGVRSGDITGVPAALPPRWKLIDGHLVGPGVDLSGLDLRGKDLGGTDLSRADLTRANLEGANLHGAELTTATWGTGTTCPDGQVTGENLRDCTDHLGRWTHVQWYFASSRSFSSPCTEEYGVVGRQVCDGGFADKPGPDPNIGYWPFTSGKGGTMIADRVAGSQAIELKFFTAPQSLIVGTVPSEQSDRFSVSDAVVDQKGGLFRTPADAPGPVGEKTGPLRLTVDGHCNAVHYCTYDFKVDGWAWAP